MEVKKHTYKQLYEKRMYYLSYMVRRALYKLLTVCGKLTVFSYTVLGSKKPRSLIPLRLHSCDSILEKKDEKLNILMSDK